jgi:LysR family transcriptional regulator, nitrogen assimilation regulatory protein
MELRQIRYFIHVASLRSFTKAARVLNVAQPALSRHIQSLEDELRTQLLFRTTRGVVPTDAGVALMQLGESVLAFVEQMREEVSRAADVPSGKVIVGMPQSISPSLAPLLMEACRTRLPKVQLRVTEGLSVFLEEWLNVAKIDVALMTNPGKVLTLHTSLLAREHMVLVGKADNMPASKSKIALADIAKFPLLIAHGFRRLIDQWTEPRGIKLNYVMELDSITIIKEMIKRGFGYSILPYATVHAEALSGDLGVTPITDPTITRDFVVAVNARRPLSAAVKAVRELIVEKLAEIELQPRDKRVQAPSHPKQARISKRIKRDRARNKKARAS